MNEFIRVNGSNIEEFLDFISNIDLKKINPNALLLYAEPEKFVKELNWDLK